MAETPSKVPVTGDKTPEGSSGVQASGPFDSLRRQVDRLFEDFDRDFWRSPFRRFLMSSRFGGVN
jgi:HSP20 family protein